MSVHTAKLRMIGHLLHKASHNTAAQQNTFVLTSKSSSLKDEINDITCRSDRKILPCAIAKSKISAIFPGKHSVAQQHTVKVKDVRRALARNVTYVIMTPLPRRAFVVQTPEIQRRLEIKNLEVPINVVQLLLLTNYYSV